MGTPEERLTLLEQLLDAEHRHARALQQLADARHEWALHPRPDTTQRVRVAESAAELADQQAQQARDALAAADGAQASGTAAGINGDAEPGCGPDGGGGQAPADSDR